MAAEGHSVVVITHKLHEVMEVADRVTVLRGGRSIATVRTSDVTRNELASLMVGRDVEPERRREPGEIGEVVLEAHGLSARGDRGVDALRTSPSPCGPARCSVSQASRATGSASSPRC
jgi:simple sugar transport system ATP-binding protein